MNISYGAYAVKNIPISPFDGNDVGVYKGIKLIRGFNSLSDDYAYTNAMEYAQNLNQRDQENEA